MNSFEVRKKFIDFFVANGHHFEESASLVPVKDDSLLFINSGMAPLKERFSNVDQLTHRRVVSAQRCLRVGGKHNDLEQVGYTNRHHTFFEMLGNFSFGDYFKREAISFAWRFLTEELVIERERLWVSVYVDDDEAFDIWTEEIGFPRERISRCGDESNFWKMGSTGPCGPCSEIFYDYGCEYFGGPPGSPDEDGGRYTEIWNLVFTQFYCAPNGSLTPLAHPCVDTGMGLERLVALLQKSQDNYETDIFRPLMAATTTFMTSPKEGDFSQPGLRVIADHIRAAAMLLADGIMPDNEGRGYVLRRIIRRAIRHGRQLGIEQIFFHRLVSVLIESSGGAWEGLVAQQKRICEVLEHEEGRFRKTLDVGLQMLEAHIAELKGRVVSGEMAFVLYDTYGFPFDLTVDILRERDFSVDKLGFEDEMAKQKARSKRAHDFKTAVTFLYEEKTEFFGYQQLECESVIVALMTAGEWTKSLKAGDAGVVFLKHSCFYAEAGGQVGDRGVLSAEGILFEVKDTQVESSGAIEHHGVLQKGVLRVGDDVQGIVDGALRFSTARNHSAAHLLHAALREVLGEGVEQRGSLVDAKKLRFDFSFMGAVPKDQLDRVETRVNEEILANSDVGVETMPVKAALEAGAMALFGEKYGDEVRVLKMGQENFSVELCGGTHVAKTGDIGPFSIVSEKSIAFGVRRIEAITGLVAQAKNVECKKHMLTLESITRGKGGQVVDKVTRLIQKNKALEKSVLQMKARLADAYFCDLSSKAKSWDKGFFVMEVVDGIDVGNVRKLATRLSTHLEGGVVALACFEGERWLIVLTINKALGDISARALLEGACSEFGVVVRGGVNAAQVGGLKGAQVKPIFAAIYTDFNPKNCS